MIARLNHPAAKAMACVCDEQAPADPTGTGPIRRKYKAKATATWLGFSTMLRKLIVDQDFFGLDAPKGQALTLRVLIPPHDRAAAFSGWLQGALKDAVDVSFDGMVRESYNAAVKRAMRLTGDARIPFQSPQAASIVPQTEIDMDGIKAAVHAQMTRGYLANVAGDKTPIALYMDLQAIVERVGVRRTHMLIDAYVVLAHAVGTLDQFESAGIKDVGIIPEFVRKVAIDDARGGPGSRLKKGQQPSRSTLYRIRKAQKWIERYERVNVLTAGDDDVCPVCEAIADDGPYSINRARQLIPAHPNCRCAFTPADDARFASGDD